MTRETRVQGLRGTLDRRRGLGRSETRLPEPSPAVMQSPAEQWIPHSRSRWSSKAVPESCSAYRETPTCRGVADAPPRTQEVGLCVLMILASNLEHAREQGRNSFSRSWNGFGTHPMSKSRFSQKRLSVTEQAVPRICSMIL